MRKREAILEELEFRGFKGKAYHFEQGRITLDDVKKMFKEMNDESTEEGKAKAYLFEKVMAKVSQLPMEIFMNEKLDNDTGGRAGGKEINYNWKYTPRVDTHRDSLCRQMRRAWLRAFTRPRNDRCH